MEATIVDINVVKIENKHIKVYVELECGIIASYSSGKTDKIKNIKESLDFFKNRSALEFDGSLNKKDRNYVVYMAILKAASMYKDDTFFAYLKKIKQHSNDIMYINSDLKQKQI